MTIVFASFATLCLAQIIEVTDEKENSFYHESHEGLFPLLVENNDTKVILTQVYAPPTTTEGNTYITVNTVQSNPAWVAVRGAGTTSVFNTRFVDYSNTYPNSYNPTVNIAVVISDRRIYNLYVPTGR